MKWIDAQCAVCGLKARTPSPRTGMHSQFRCPRCGEYDVTDDVLTVKHHSLPDLDLSGVLRNFSEEHPRDLLTVTTGNYEGLKSSAPARTDVFTKVRYLLRHVRRRSDRPGKPVSLDPIADWSVCFAASEDEMKYYFGYALKMGYITGDRAMEDYQATLTPEGWEEVSRLPTLESPKAFVAMCLSPNVDNADLLKRAYKDAIEPAIHEDAGYDAIKIDEEPFNTDIVFEIITQIRESRFVVAEVTEHRNGVYFEGGFALGMGLPVIWMCHESDMEKAHFDTSHLNHIVWTDDLEKLRKDLATRILFTVGKRGQPPQRRQRGTPS